jgi:hypothetical protein
MSDSALVRELLHQILNAAQTISKRFMPITSPDDFTNHIGPLADVVQQILAGSQ